MRLRHLTSNEAALGFLFGDTLKVNGVRLLTGVPTGGFAFVLGKLMIFPTNTRDFGLEDVRTQAWFIHELTHVWQFQIEPVRTYRSWLWAMLSLGYLTGRAYRYRLPLKDWNRLNLEQQARVVEHGWLLKQGVRSLDMPKDATWEDYAPFPPFNRNWGQRKSRRYATSGASAGGIG
jgi:hypothetical protein